MYKKQSKGYKDTMRCNPSALSQHNQQPKQWQLVALFVEINIFFLKGAGQSLREDWKENKATALSDHPSSYVLHIHWVYTAAVATESYSYTCNGWMSLC